ncbi:glutaminase A [Blastopirellula sp. JC732]|uniref:Glutaminase n=1 Tax=Blastopirellula sediminis TaxID=2894196 RepID=A0A9X1MK65_9BACT|nr:glutaminase A [Blastopirellula sediminis]MCC9609504.1 glutaminase A [Blastopirellula sediminis]MCC9627720.1 glutaminase A [Blastopirellula sediminis]
MNDHLDALLKKMKSAASPLRDMLKQLHAEFKDNHDGTVASYIPELAKANPDWFGISLVSIDGQAVDVGDSNQQFTIQSVSKAFMFGMAIEDHGRDHVLSKIGVQPIGEAFNSITLDEATNRPFNPMINAGAIAAADLIHGKDFPERVARMLKMFSTYCGRQVYVDNTVYHSEKKTGHRNRAIANLMLNFGMISEQLDDTLDLYFQQCSILVTSHDLAMMGATLANGGVNPVTGERAISAEYVKDVLAVMHTCGMYDYAGEWAFRVGIPAKSGVGGGIVSVVPGEVGIGTFSPRLDAKGNSVRGIQFYKALAEKYGLHAFEAKSERTSLLSQL